MKMVGKIFTGQSYIGGRESVACAKCKGAIGLRRVMPQDTGLAWFDPYRGKGKYVHRKCLSRKRQAEIVNDKEEAQ